MTKFVTRLTLFLALAVSLGTDLSAQAPEVPTLPGQSTLADDESPSDDEGLFLEEPGTLDEGATMDESILLNDGADANNDADQNEGADSDEDTDPYPEAVPENEARPTNPGTANEATTDTCLTCDEAAENSSIPRPNAPSIFPATQEADAGSPTSETTPASSPTDGSSAREEHRQSNWIGWALVGFAGLLLAGLLKLS